MATKIYAQLSGKRKYVEEGTLVAVSSMVEEVAVAWDKAVSRKTTYGLGRGADEITKITFIERDETGASKTLAEATATNTHWNIVYKDGKPHDQESLTTERSEARRPGPNWKRVSLENGARDLGPDVQKLSSFALANLGVVERKSGATSQTKAQLDEEKAKNETLVAMIRALGKKNDMSDEDIETMIADAFKRADETAPAEKENVADPAKAGAPAKAPKK